jgi:glycosyltransferase involved in cell wall biosynthesis
MRILYHHRTQGEEPESIHIDSIVQALRALGHEVRIVGPAPLAHKPTGEQRPTFLGRIKRAAPQAVFELLQIGYNLIALLRMRRAINEFRPDLIYERYALYSFAGVSLARLRGIAFILEVNTPYAQAWARYYGLTFRRLARAIEGRILRAAGHLITVTHVQKQMLEQLGVPGERITVCHNAIDPDWFSPQRHADPLLRTQLGLTGVVVGFVGTMNRWQGITEFPAVLQQVFAQSDHVSFLFVGDGEFRGQLEQFCRTHHFEDRVVFTGRKPHAEIPALIAAMDVAVLLNSNSYGSPMKIFEYLGMGKAVIAPRVGPVTEVLDDGHTGLLIDAGNGAQMAAQILRLVGDPALRERLGSNGRAHVVERHTWRANAAAVLKAFADITGRPAGAP